MKRIVVEGDAGRLLLASIKCEMLLMNTLGRPEEGGLFYNKETGVFSLFVNRPGSTRLELFFLEHPEEYAQVVHKALEIILGEDSQAEAL